MCALETACCSSSCSLARASFDSGATSLRCVCMCVCVCVCGYAYIYIHPYTHTHTYTCTHTHTHIHTHTHTHTHTCMLLFSTGHSRQYQRALWHPLLIATYKDKDMYATISVCIKHSLLLHIRIQICMQLCMYVFSTELSRQCLRAFWHPLLIAGRRSG